MKKIDTDFNEKLGKFWLRFSSFVILTNSVLNLKQAQHGSSIHHLELKISEIAMRDLCFGFSCDPTLLQIVSPYPKTRVSCLGCRA